MKKILVINLGWEQEPLLDLIASRNLDMYGVHYDAAYSRQYPFKDVLITDLRKLNAILDFADQVQPDAVISDQCDYSYFAQACIAERHGLPGPGLGQAQLSSNKYLQRLYCAKNDILVPDFALCTSLDDVDAFLQQYGFPIILKPVDNRGSFGVNKVENKEEISNAFFDAMANSHARMILAEKFIQGTHVTVDGYAFTDIGPVSLSLASKKMLGSNRQVAMDIVYPGRIPRDVYDKTMQCNASVCKTLGYRFGMTHCEYMITGQKDVYLIEAANRGGGCFTSEVICPAVSGVSIVDQYLDDALGLDTRYFEGRVQRNQVVLTFFSFGPGKIKSIRHAEKIAAMPGVLKFRIGVSPGDVIQPVTTDANRHGFIIFQAEEDIHNTVEKILETIQVEYV